MVLSPKVLPLTKNDRFRRGRRISDLPSCDASSSIQLSDVIRAGRSETISKKDSLDDAVNDSSGTTFLITSFILRVLQGSVHKNILDVSNTFG